jgi:hypothetical protein
MPGTAAEPQGTGHVSTSVPACARCGVDSAKRVVRIRKPDVMERLCLPCIQERASLQTGRMSEKCQYPLFLSCWHRPEGTLAWRYSGPRQPSSTATEPWRSRAFGLTLCCSIQKCHSDKIALPPNHAALTGCVKIIERQLKVQRQDVTVLQPNSCASVRNIVNRASEYAAPRVEIEQRALRDHRSTN